MSTKVRILEGLIQRFIVTATSRTGEGRTLSCNLLAVVQQCASSASHHDICDCALAGLAAAFTDSRSFISIVSAEFAALRAYLQLCFTFRSIVSCQLYGCIHVGVPRVITGAVKRVS